jgi:hypothetical protein
MPKYRLKSLPGTFSGLQLLAYMYVGFKRLEPATDIGVDFAKEYEEALKANYVCLRGSCKTPRNAAPDGLRRGAFCKVKRPAAQRGQAWHPSLRLVVFCTAPYRAQNERDKCSTESRSCLPPPFF